MNKKNTSVFNRGVSFVLSILPKSPYSHLLIVLVVAFGFEIGYGVSNGIIPIQQPLAITKVHNFTRAEYERLELAMLLIEVEAILGRGTETEQTTKTATFIWQNPDKSTIVGIFEDGKLVHKKQEGF